MDDELNRRISDFRNSCGSPYKVERLTVSSVSIDHLEHEEVKQINKEFKTAVDGDGLAQLMHRFWADVNVSESASKRAFELLHRFVFECKQIGVIFNLSTEPKANNLYLSKKRTESKRGYIELYDERFFVRIKEKILSETIQMPAEITDKRKGRTNFSRSIQSLDHIQTKTIFRPTGHLSLSILTFGFNYEIQKIEDTPRSDIESKLTKMLARFEMTAATRKVERDIRAEQSRERERKKIEWQEKKLLKDSLLRKLSEYESIAKNLDRSDSLKRLVDRIERHPSPPKALLDDLEFLKRAAAWLDPFNESKWDE